MRVWQSAGTGAPPWARLAAMDFTSVPDHDAIAEAVRRVCAAFDDDYWARGIGEVALARAVAYAREREVFGRPIGANQAIAHPLAQAHMQLAAAWQVARHAAWRYDRGLDCGEAAQTAKYLAAEAGFLAADRAVQTLGGMGYATEYHVHRNPMVSSAHR